MFIVLKVSSNISIYIYIELRQEILICKTSFFIKQKFIYKLIFKNLTKQMFLLLLHE